jgi:glycosyltransferase involved in cell wall biosynthesis
MTATRHPFFSVVIPAYNRPQLLLRALNSVLSQSFTNYEIIVIDDHSPEDLTPIIEKCKVKALTYVRLEKNTGGGGARNAGINHSKGLYISFLDSDDYWYPEKLQETYNAIVKNKEVDCIISGIDIIKKDGTHTIHLPGAEKSGIFESILFKKNIIQTSALTLNKKITQKIMFSENLKKHQDLDLYIRLDNSGIKPHYIKTALVAWDISHEQPSISRTASTVTSVAWLKSVQNEISPASYRAFATKHIIAREINLRDAIAIYKVVIKNSSICEKIHIAVTGVFWLATLAGRRFLQ